MYVLTPVHAHVLYAIDAGPYPPSMFPETEPLNAIVCDAVRTVPPADTLMTLLTAVPAHVNGFTYTTPVPVVGKYTVAVCVIITHGDPNDASIE